MVAVITRQTSDRPQLVLIPGGRSASPPTRRPAGYPPIVVAGISAARVIAGRMSASRVVVYRIIACCLLALAVVAGLWMVLRAIGGVAGGGPLTSSGAPAGALRPTPGQVWIVRPGDTLWGIVEAAGIKGDPRPVVDEMAATLHGQVLQPGQAVTVP